MQHIIIAYLFQHGQCVLPGIGKLKIIHTPARFDVTTNTMEPPKDQIEFEETASIITGNLIDVISLKKSITKDAARNLFEQYCSETRTLLDNMDVVVIDTLGTLYKNEAGHIEFKRADTNSFLFPVSAMRLHTNAVQDQVSEESIIEDNKEIRHEKVKEKKQELWWKMITILALLAIIVIAIRFYKQPFNTEAVGNGTKIHVAKPLTTHD